MARCLDKGHGRIEKRTLRSTTALSHGYLDWPGLGQCFEVVRERTCKGKTTREVAYGITSLPREKASAAELLEHLRGHWSIESLFWIKDVTFGEDACCCRTGSAPLALSSLRHAAITMLDHAGRTNKAAALRRHAARPEEALAMVKSRYG